MTAFRLLWLAAQPPPDSKPPNRSADAQIRTKRPKAAAHSANAASSKISVRPVPFPIAYKQKNTGQCASPQRPRHAPAPPGAFIRLQSVIEKPCLFPLSRALFHKTQRAPNRNRTQASRPHPSPHPAHKSRTRKRAPDNAQAHSILTMNRPARRVHSPSSRHRKALFPLSRALFHRTQRAPDRKRTQASRPHSPSHPAHKSRTRKRAPDNAQAHSVPAMPPPRPARSFSYCAIIALPCGAFRASSAARR